MKAAGFWIRALASLLDGILLTIVSYGVELAVLGAAYWFKVLVLGGGTAVSFNDFVSAVFIQVLNLVIYGLLSLAYYGYGHWHYGTTLGKKPFGIRVVTMDGGKITLTQSLLRCVAYVASYIPLCAGFLMAAWNPEKRALHELLSGTRSVRAEG